MVLQSGTEFVGERIQKDNGNDPTNNLKLTEIMLCSGGATNPYPSVQESLQLPAMGLYGPATDKLLSEVSHGLRSILETGNKYTLALIGSGMTGMSALLDNLLEPDDIILICATGFWGDAPQDVAQRLGAKVVRKVKELGESFKLSELEDMVTRVKPGLLYLVNGDSSSGVFQCLDGVGEICQKNNCLLICDVVATIGQQPIKMDERRIDAIFANSQKGLGGVVGQAIISFSPRAIAKVRARKSPLKNRTYDIFSQARAWNIEKCPIRETSYLQSLSHSMLYMLRSGLQRIFQEGLENCYNRHQESSSLLYQGAAQIRLEPFVPLEESRLSGTATFKCPPGLDSFKIANYILEKYRIDVSPGFGPMLGKVVRVGLFGYNAEVRNVERILEALKDAMNSPLVHINKSC